MAFKVPASKRSHKQNRFEFELPDGREFSIPLAKYMTVGQVERFSELGEDVSMVDLLSIFEEPDAAAAIRDLDAEQLEALLDAWQEESGISTGESSASEQTS